MVNKGGNGEEEEAKGMMRSAQLERGYSHHFLAGIVMVGARVLTAVANTMRRSGIMMGLGRLDVTTSQRDTQVLRVGHVRACTGERMIVCSGEREREGGTCRVRWRCVGLGQLGRCGCCCLPGQAHA